MYLTYDELSSVMFLLPVVSGAYVRRGEDVAVPCVAVRRGGSAGRVCRGPGPGHRAADHRPAIPCLRRYQLRVRQP